MYNPLFDIDLLPEEREYVFARWVSGYFEHGDTVETLALKTPLPKPPSTLLTFTAEDMERVLCLPPGAPGGSEALLLHGGIAVGLWNDLREAALALPSSEGGSNGDAWREVEVRNVTCERSVCECLFAWMCLREEVEAAKAKGCPTRDVRFVLIKGANHFVRGPISLPYDDSGYLLTSWLHRCNGISQSSFYARWSERRTWSNDGSRFRERLVRAKHTTYASTYAVH